jgi:hypothetical protein
MRLIRKLLALSGREWRDLLAAQHSLLRAEWRMRRRPSGTLLSRWTSSTHVEQRSEPGEVLRAQEIGKAVRRVAFHGLPRSQCLVRSLAICELLEGEGIRGAIVRVGVQPRDATLAAHAWVELGGAIIGDTPEHVGSFQLLATAHGAADR